MTHPRKPSHFSGWFGEEYNISPCSIQHPPWTPNPPTNRPQYLPIHPCEWGICVESACDKAAAAHVKSTAHSPCIISTNTCAADTPGNYQGVRVNSGLLYLCWGEYRGCLPQTGGVGWTVLCKKVAWIYSDFVEKVILQSGKIKPEAECYMDIIMSCLKQIIFVDVSL